MLVNGDDCLRDDGIIYEKWLQAAGITNVRLRLLEGHGHTAWATQVMTSPEQRVELKKASLEGLAWLLGKDFDGNADGAY